MLEREPTETGKFVRTSTPLSLAIQAVGLVIAITALFVMPRLVGDIWHEPWGSLSVGAILLVLLRASRNAMALSPEVDDRLLSYADRRRKHTLKFLLILAGFAFIILMGVVISGGGDLSTVSFADMPWARKISIGLLVVVYLGSTVLGHVYVRRFVKRRKAS